MPLVLVCFIAALLQVACDTTADTNKTAFYYYPEKNVYYNITKKTYLYSLDGATTWDSMYDASSRRTKLLGKSVTIYFPGDSIWKDNLLHRERYNGMTYGIITEKNRHDSGYNGAREKRVVKKTAVKKEEEEKKKNEKKKTPEEWDDND